MDERYFAARFKRREAGISGLAVAFLRRAKGGYLECSGEDVRIRVSGLARFDY